MQQKKRNDLLSNLIFLFPFPVVVRDRIKRDFSSPFPPKLFVLPVIGSVITGFLCLFSTHVFSQGIQFVSFADGTSLRAKGQPEDKLQLLYCYRSWSTPCQKMSSQVFPDSTLGDFFNRHFINTQLDLDLPEGQAFAAKYHVQLYPTFLFIDVDGTVVQRAVGFQGIADFLALGKSAADPLLQLPALERRYASGDRTARTLFALTIARTAAKSPGAGQAANEYLQTQTNFGSAANLDFILRYVDDPFSDGFSYLVANRPALEQQTSPKIIAAKLDSVVQTYLLRHPNLALGELQYLYGTVYPEQAARMASYCRLDFFRQRGATGQFAECAVDHYRRFPSDDPEELNRIAAIFARDLQDDGLLHNALVWAKRSVTLQETAANELTLAQLNWKLGKKKAANQAANRALELSESGNTVAVHALLDIINGK